MAALDEASRAHEEYRLRLEAEKDIRLAGLDVQRQVAEAQATVLATGLENADINIVGGESVFFDRLMSSIALGKSVDGFVQHSETAQALAKPYLDGTSNLPDDLGRVTRLGLHGGRAEPDRLRPAVEAHEDGRLRPGAEAPRRGGWTGPLAEPRRRPSTAAPRPDRPTTWSLRSRRAGDGGSEPTRGKEPRGNRGGHQHTGDAGHRPAHRTEHRPAHRPGGLRRSRNAGHRNLRGAAGPAHRAGRRTRPAGRGAQRPPSRGVRLGPARTHRHRTAGHRAGLCATGRRAVETRCSSDTTRRSRPSPRRPWATSSRCTTGTSTGCPRTPCRACWTTPPFVREFGALYRYYRQATLIRLRRVEGRLLAVFRTGEKADDIRVLRWALTEDGRAAFLDARGDRDHVLPPSHDFTWTEATREDHVLGRHPHVSVRGEVFVATVGGALTVKVDNDTETAQGIHGEPSTSRSRPSPTRRSPTRAWVP